MVINDCAVMSGTYHTVKFSISENYAQKQIVFSCKLKHLNRIGDISC